MHDSMPARTTTVLPSAASGDLCLSAPVHVGGDAVTMPIEIGHCEWLLRLAAARAVQGGTLAGSEPAWARLMTGRVGARHGEAQCLLTLRVEVSDREGRVVRRVEFPRELFADFARARAVALLGRAGQPTDPPPGGSATTVATPPRVTYALHAEGTTTGRLAVAVPELASRSITALQAGATASGAPAADWIVTFVSARARAGLAELARRSRAAGIEVAGRVAADVGFDPTRRAFVRVLDEVVIAEGSPATSYSVVSSAASWATFLATAVDRRAPTSVHTHVECEAGRDPIISVDDIVTHLTVFPDPLSACVIVSVSPDDAETTLYGYAPTGWLRRESGYWLLGDGAEPRRPATTRDPNRA